MWGMGGSNHPIPMLLMDPLYFLAMEIKKKRKKRGRMKKKTCSAPTSKLVVEIASSRKRLSSHPYADDPFNLVTMFCLSCNVVYCIVVLCNAIMQCYLLISGVLTPRSIRSTSSLFSQQRITMVMMCLLWQ